MEVKQNKQMKSTTTTKQPALLVTSLTVGANRKIVRHRESFDETKFYGTLLTNRDGNNGIHIYSDFTVCKHFLYFPVYFCQQILFYSDSLNQKLLINITSVSVKLTNF